MNDLATVRIGGYYEPQPRQQEFHESAARYPLAEGGRGFHLMGTRTGRECVQRGRTGKRQQIWRSTLS